MESVAVTTTNQAQKALELLRENKNKFDLVISDVDMPDMDGFKLLELVGLEMDLPVISKSYYYYYFLIKLLSFISLMTHYRNKVLISRLGFVMMIFLLLQCCLRIVIRSM